MVTKEAFVRLRIFSSVAVGLLESLLKPFAITQISILSGGLRSRTATRQPEKLIYSYCLFMASLPLLTCRPFPLSLIWEAWTWDVCRKFSYCSTVSTLLLRSPEGRENLFSLPPSLPFCIPSSEILILKSHNQSDIK